MSGLFTFPRPLHRAQGLRFTSPIPLSLHCFGVRCARPRRSVGPTCGWRHQGDCPFKNSPACAEGFGGHLKARQVSSAHALSARPWGFVFAKCEFLASFLWLLHFDSRMAEGDKCPIWAHVTLFDPLKWYVFQGSNTCKFLFPIYLSLLVVSRSSCILYSLL